MAGQEDQELLENPGHTVSRLPDGRGHRRRVSTQTEGEGVNHVSTQLPYAITAASCAAVCYVITGIAQAFLGANGSLLTSLILLAVAIAVELAVLNVIRLRTKKTKQA